MCNTNDELVRGRDLENTNHDDPESGEFGYADQNLEEDGFEEEYGLPPDSMCVHHDDEPAVNIRDGEPLCQQCDDDYCDTFRGDD